ncbi:MAG: SDR family NAD(P)-dependent oxidoreductase [Sulfitobacter sp.]
MAISFEGRVAMVTGAGTGLGRAHALGLAARGAKVLINDMGVARDGTGRSSEAAEAVVAEIEAAGGTAMSHGADVSDAEAVQNMIARTMDAWGRIDICVNNAGILLDKTFAKMDMAAFRKVVDVHLIGSANVTHACWPIMQAQKYGRIVLTSSGSGLYGQFGQSNYGAAKAAMLGLMNVLQMEGARDDIRVNMLAPIAATRMTEDMLPDDVRALLVPEAITPGLLYLVSEDAPHRMILGAGAGSYVETRIYETQGITLTEAENTPEAVAAQIAEIRNPDDQQQLGDALGQTRKYALNAARAKGLKLDW